MVRFTAELVLHGQHYHVQCAEKIKIKLIEQRTVEHLSLMTIHNSGISRVTS